MKAEKRMFYPVMGKQNTYQEDTIKEDNKDEFWRVAVRRRRLWKIVTRALQVGTQYFNGKIVIMIFLKSKGAAIW